MRGKQAKKRKIEPDAVFQSTLVSKLINKVMLHGKRTLAERMVYKSFEQLKNTVKKDPLEVFEKAIENITPQIEVRPRRVGGVNYQVPVPVPEHRQVSLALNWLVSGARSRRSREEFFVAIADEISDAYKKSGFAYKKKEDVQKMADANKAFAHFQW